MLFVIVLLTGVQIWVHPLIELVEAYLGTNQWSSLKRPKPQASLALLRFKRGSYYVVT